MNANLILDITSCLRNRTDCASPGFLDLRTPPHPPNGSLIKVLQHSLSAILETYINLDWSLLFFLFSFHHIPHLPILYQFDLLSFSFPSTNSLRPTSGFIKSTFVLNSPPRLTTTPTSLRDLLDLHITTYYHPIQSSRTSCHQSL